MNKDFRHPNTESNTQYPYNQVTVTESGHQFEVDDTPGAERIREAHKSGTYYEISADGRKVDVVTNNYYQYVKGGITTTVENNIDQKVKGGVRTSISGDQHIESAGNVSQVVKGNSVQAIGGNAISYTKGDINNITDGNVTTSVKGNLTQAVSGNVSNMHEGDSVSSSKGNSYEHVEGTRTISITGEHKVESSEKITLKVNDIEINITGNQVIIKLDSPESKLILNDKNVGFKFGSVWFYANSSGFFNSGHPTNIGPAPAEN